MHKWKLTFTALAVSSENGGTTPDNTAASDKLNSNKLARVIVLFAPENQVTKCKISNFQCYLQMIDVYSTVYKPERWTYERRYTKVKDKRAEIYAAITTFPSHSGVPPGFLHSKECILDAGYT
jgi:hypothetical protein